jgi:hypothetical protein
MMSERCPKCHSPLDKMTVGRTETRKHYECGRWWLFYPHADSPGPTTVTCSERQLAALRVAAKGAAIMLSRPGKMSQMRRDLIKRLREEE